MERSPPCSPYDRVAARGLVRVGAGVGAGGGAATAIPSPIVTEIAPASIFYPAENYHQDYYRQNKNRNPYCQYVITPKLDKLGLKS